MPLAWNVLEPMLVVICRPLIHENMVVKRTVGNDQRARMVIDASIHFMVLL